MAKANLPGPGQYIDPGAASQSKDALRSSAVFKSSITREKALLGKATNQEVPGPGAYHEPAKTFASGTKPEHLQFFGSTATRFDSAQRFVPFLLLLLGDGLLVLIPWLGAAAVNRSSLVRPRTTILRQYRGRIQGTSTKLRSRPSKSGSLLLKRKNSP